MIRRLARLFSLLSFAAVLAAAYFLWPPQVPPESAAPLADLLDGPIDLIRIEKAARRLTILEKGQPVRSYSIALGFAPEGDKSRQGDGRTPEGRFKIDRRNEKSAFHLSLGLDYPQAEDRARARKGGYDPGGDIMIHGQPNEVPDDHIVKGDWTLGCIALANAEIREIWPFAPVGTEVEILP